MRVISRITGAALGAALFAGGLVQAGHAGATEPESELPTPALIERALRRGSIDQTRRNLFLAYAFGRPEKLPEAYRSDVPWEGTAPLLELQRAQRAMPPGPARSEIGEILSGETGPGWCGPHSGGSLPSSTTTPHFYIEHGSIGGGLSIGNYTAALETSWTTEVDSFGWAAPPVWSPNSPPGNTYHVRVDALPSGLYGYVTTSGAHAGPVGNNPNSSWDDTDSHATCMVLRNDYSDSGFPSSPQASLNATAAHEFNHSIQFGYGALHGSNRPDYVFVEGGATWMEDEVFDTANDNYYFLWPAFAESMGDYDGSLFAYETWITLRGLTERYGTGTADGGEQIMQDFWEETSKNTGDSLTALQTALANRGANLADAYHSYAIAVKSNRTCAGGYVYPYCLEEGPGYVAARGATGVHGAIASVGGSFNGSIEDNYALNWVQLPTGSAPYPVKLINTSGGGQLRGSVVCDTGSSLTVTPLPAVVAAGLVATLTAFDPSGCASVVAVITNQSQTHANPPSSAARSYLLATDVTPPAAPALDGSTLSKPFQTTTKFDLSWGVTEAMRYDVRYRSAPYGTDFGGFVTWQSGTSGTIAVFNGLPGRSYCFSARATDADLNTSDYGAERCTAIPAANTALKHRGHWAKRKGSGYFLGAFSMSSTQGANLVLKNARAKRLAIVVTKCPGCGTIKVFFRNKLLRTIRLRAGSIRKKQIVGLAIFNAVRTGKLRALITSSGRPVKIEGVGVSRE